MIKFVLKLLLVATCSSLLVACQSYPKNETAYWYKIPSGSTLILTQNLTVPPKSYRVFLQAGKVIAKRALNIREPYCYFRIEDWSLTESREIPAAEFTVTQIFRKVVYTALEQDGAYAMTPMWLFNDNDRSDQSLATIIRLFAADVPQIPRLVCERFIDPVPYNHLSIAQIKAALGSIVTLNVAVGP